MLWIKALHLIAVIAWLAGLFYLPRIFVHYAEGRAARRGCAPAGDHGARGCSAS